MRTRKKHTRKLKKYNVFLLIIILVLAILLFLNTYIILKYNVLPYKYLVVYFAIIIIVPSVSLFILIKKQKNRILKIIFASLMIIFEIFLGFIFYYLCTTFNFLDRTFITHNYITRNYYVLVDKKSDYKKIDDLNNKNLGYVEVLNMNYDKAIEHINSKIKIDTKDYIDLTIMLEAFELKE